MSVFTSRLTGRMEFQHRFKECECNCGEEEEEEEEEEEKGGGRKGGGRRVQARWRAWPTSRLGTLSNSFNLCQARGSGAETSFNYSKSHVRLNCTTNLSIGAHSLK